MAWAATYGHPPFVVDPESRLGQKVLEEPRWPLTFAVLLVAYGGSEELAAWQWTAFSLLWRQGIWNGPLKAGQKMDRSEAETRVWAGLKQGFLKAYSDIDDEMQPIDAYKWDNLEWVADGLGQVVGYGTKPVYRGVVVDAESVKALARIDGGQPSQVATPRPETADEQVQAPRSRRGRPPGTGFADADAALAELAIARIKGGEPSKQVYLDLAKQALGSGTVESRADRLRHRVKARGGE